MVSSTAGLATPLSPPNGNVLRSTDARRMPGRGGGGASPSPGNPFVAAAFPPAATTAPDPFAQLATGLMSATPRKKPDKNDFIPEIPKPSLADLSQQQQQQQQQQQLGNNVTAQTNVDLFGATPVSVDTLEASCHLDAPTYIRNIGTSEPLVQRRRRSVAVARQPQLVIQLTK